MRPVRTKARTTLATFAAGVAIIVSAAPAAAISSVNSSPAPERTEVGFLGVAVDVDGDGVIDLLDGYCSGTMIDSDTFLTAAHCTDNFPSGQRFFVSLEQDVLSVLIAGAGLPPDEFIELGLTNGWIVEGDMHRDPRFPANTQVPQRCRPARHRGHRLRRPRYHTNRPVDLYFGHAAHRRPARRDRCPCSRRLRLGGRSARAWRHSEAGGAHPSGGFVRLKALLDFTALRTTWVQLAMNESRDLGGVCYGDSGGPNYVDIDRTLISGRSHERETPCYATAMQYRTDTPSSRAFLADFVSLP